MIDSAMKLSDILKGQIPEEYKDIKPISADSFEQKQCEWYNQSEGRLSGINCPECKNRGNFQYIDADGYRRMRECRCMANRRYIQMMHNAGLGDLYEKCTFDAYIVKTDWQERCKAFSQKYAAQDGNGWYLFGGQSGTGKTHLCTAICSELAKRGRDIKYVQWKRLYDKLIQTRFKGAEQEQLFRECETADVLYIDDFLKMPKNNAPSADMLSYALEIIDARYKADKKTIISTEFMIDDIVSFDEALGGRLKEKTRGNKCMVERKDGRNYRMRG
jgi:DNA replication protein DnaC